MQEGLSAAIASDVGQYVLLASAAVADGTQSSILCALQTVEAAIRRSSCDLAALKAQHTIMTGMIPPDALMEDEHDQVALPHDARFVRGLFLKPIPGVPVCVFVPDVPRRLEWAKHCASSSAHVPFDV